MSSWPPMPTQMRTPVIGSRMASRNFWTCQWFDKQVLHEDFAPCEHTHAQIARNGILLTQIFGSTNGKHLSSCTTFSNGGCFPAPLLLCTRVQASILGSSASFLRINGFSAVELEACTFVDGPSVPPLLAVSVETCCPITTPPALRNRQ